MSDNERLKLLKKYVCAAETLEEFLHRIDAVRADEVASLDDDIPQEGPASPGVGAEATVEDRVGTWIVTEYDQARQEGVLSAYSEITIFFSRAADGGFRAYNNAVVSFQPVCMCCTFGNHGIICTCDGKDCCHPEAYKQYNPAWGHGPLQAKPEEK
jgi:hypothetical protein